VPIDGRKLVRISYLDESGLGKKEPIIVVGAVIVHVDTLLAPIEDYLGALVEKHIPADKRDGFFFHATDIYHGGGKKCIFRDKSVWPDERRWKILDDLVAIPAKFDLPICIGSTSRTLIESQIPTYSPSQKVVAAHCMAMINCEVAIDIWMKKNTHDEFTILTAENNYEVRDIAKKSHNLFKDGASMALRGFGAHEYFPLTKIKEGLHFADKSDSKILQIADVCAWAYRRHLNELNDSSRFFEPMRKNVNSILENHHIL
jgi:hypothetical protein